MDDLQLGLQVSEEINLQLLGGAFRRHVVGHATHVDNLTQLLQKGCIETPQGLFLDLFVNLRSISFTYSYGR